MQGDIPGSGPQFAAFKSNIAQRAIVQHVDAGKLVAIAKISPDSFEQKYNNQHGLAFPRKTWCDDDLWWHRSINAPLRGSGATRNSRFPP
jgi:hypothetical protein